MSTRVHRPSDRRLTAAWLAAGVLLLCSPGLALARIFEVTINADGTFSPKALTISPGDTVRWTFSERADSVIPTQSRICSTVKPYEAGSFAGPMPEAVSGIFSLGPFDRGLVEVSAQAGCALDTEGPRVTSADGATVLCRDGALYETMRSTWENPAISGVFISIPWKKLHIHPGTDPSNFDFSLLDREINAAVRHGKLYSLAIPAGKDSIPDWVYEPYIVEEEPKPPLAHSHVPVLRMESIPRIEFRDGASELEDDKCGAAVPIASPTHPRYQQYYADLLTGLAAHLKTRADRFRALAYIKPAGANLFTDEARLPKRCKTIDVDPADGIADCVCNTELWAQHGYTPDGLYQFYRDQTALISELFPGKIMSYQLIQDGFPRVGYDGSDWLVREGANATTHSGAPLDTLPGAFEQTVAILNNGQTDHGTRFAVQHNGLKADPQDCATAGLHPADLPWNQYSETGSGCPNKWVLREGAEGQITGFQTSNKKEVIHPRRSRRPWRTRWTTPTRSSSSCTKNASGRSRNSDSRRARAFRPTAFTIGATTPFLGTRPSIRCPCPARSAASAAPFST